MRRLELSPKQAQFAEAVLSGKYLYLLFGGAIRGGKSFGVLSVLIALCKIYPGSRWAVVRKDLPTIKRNTIPTFEQMAPRPFVGQINRSDWLVKCQNGSEILFFPESVKDDPEYNRWRGLEVNGFVLEEANELTEGAFNKAVERAGSWQGCKKERPKPIIMMTCNPSQGYVKRIFYDPYTTGSLKPPFFYLPSKITDNPHLDPQYVKSLKNLEKTDPVAYKRFVEGDWNTSEDPDQLIKYEWVSAARDVEPVDGRVKLGVDVARYGNDDTVICHLVGNSVMQLDYHHGLSTERVASIVSVLIHDIPVNADEVNVDAVGLGAGVVDSLGAKGYEVNEIISGAAAPEDEKSVFRFKNLRSYMWWMLREAFRLGEICLEVDDHRLVEDLTAVRYMVDSDKVIRIESKEQMRKRINRSTDAGDALVYAWHCVPKMDFIFY